MTNWMLLLMVTLAEATIGVFVKLTAGAIPIQTLNFYAVSFAAVFLLATLPLATGKRLRAPWGNLRDTLLVGILIAAQISVFNFAMTRAPIANVVVFWSVAPFFVFIFSTLFLKEKPRKVHALIFAVAILGIVLAKPLEGGHMLGNLVALADGAVYAAMIVYLRSEGKSEPGNDIAWFMVAAALILSPALIVYGPGDIFMMVHYEILDADLPVVLWAAGLGFVSTGVAYLCISIVLKTINANIYSLVDIIVSPVVAAFLGYAVFGEIPSDNMIYGGTLLLGSGFWLSWEMAKQGKRQAAHPCQCT